MGLAAARAKAEQWRGWVKEGIDHAEAEAEKKREAEKQRHAAALQAANTFEVFAEKYIAERTNRRAKADAAEIRRLLICEWGTQPLHAQMRRPAGVTFRPSPTANASQIVYARGLILSLTTDFSVNGFAISLIPSGLKATLFYWLSGAMLDLSSLNA